MDSLENKEEQNRLQVFMFASIALYFFWITFMAPPSPPVEMENASVQEAPEEEAKNISPTVKDNVSAEGVEERSFPLSQKELSSNELSLQVSSKYGGLNTALLKEYTELPKTESWWGWIFGGMTNSWTPYSEGTETLSILGAEGDLVVVGQGDSASKNRYQLKELADGSIAATAQIGAMNIEKIYRISEGEDFLSKHTIEIDLRIKNTGDTELTDVWIGAFEQMGGDAGRFDNVSRPQFFVDDELVGTFATMFSTSFFDLDDLEEPTVFEKEAEWFGIGSRYFLTALYTDSVSQKGLFQNVSTKKIDDGVYGVISTLSKSIDSGATREIRLKAYVGPKQMDILEQLGDSWTQSVEYGMFGFFSRVLLFMLKVIQAGFVNWGVSILLLTLIVKVIFFPLTQKAFMSGKKMQALQPRLKEIKEKYKDNQQLQAQETMKIFSDNNVSPLGGCLPTLIQIPVWFSLYNVMLYSVELYDSSFLYLQDLTSADPYGVLPVLYCGLMLIQQRMMPMANMDPAQQKMMKMMPLMFGIFMFTFPSGLVLYFSMNILLTIFQQWLIRVQFDENSLLTQDKA